MVVYVLYYYDPDAEELEHYGVYASEEAAKTAARNHLAVRFAGWTQAELEAASKSYHVWPFTVEGL